MQQPHQPHHPQQLHGATAQAGVVLPLARRLAPSQAPPTHASDAPPFPVHQGVMGGLIRPKPQPPTRAGSAGFMPWSTAGQPPPSINQITTVQASTPAGPPLSDAGLAAIQQLLATNTHVYNYLLAAGAPQGP